MSGVSAIDTITQSAMVPFMPAFRFLSAVSKSAACTSMYDAVRFSMPLFSSRVMKLSLHLYQRSPVSSKKSSLKLARFTADTENSPEIKGDTSSMMRASASVKERASTR